MSKLVADGSSVASQPDEVPVWAIVLDSHARVWERSGRTTSRTDAVWNLLTGDLRGLRRGFHTVNSVTFPVTVLARSRL